VVTRRTLLFAPLSLAFAQNSDPLRAGFRQLYHLRFAEARDIFQAWQHDHPSDPMGFIAEAAAHLFEEFEAHGVLTAAFFLDDDRLLGGIKGTANAERTRTFESACSQGRALAERQAKRDARDTNAQLALALAAGLRADYLSIIEKSQVASLREIHAADGFAERLLKLSPSVTDAYVALGAANYILACLPSYKRAVLWFGGLQGDKRRGIEQLTRAARDGYYLGPYAKVMLALALLREKRGSEARRLIHELTDEFPESPLFTREKAAIDRLAGIR
jgi:hypothetical protein